MALGGCLTCVKYLLFIFNFLFWLIGCILLGLGIWLVVDQKNSDVLSFLQEINLNVGGYGLIIIGSIVMVVGFFGCCGAIRESQCLLITFFICLFIIFGVMLGLGIFYAVDKGASEELVGKTYKELADKYSDSGKEAAREQVDNIHKQLKCCGYKLGSADFGSTKPAGCVPDPILLCPKAIVTEINAKRLMIAGVGLGIAVVLLLGMIFSLMLCCAIRDSV